ncbi:vacuolar protein-sorting-associated protein 25-like [Tropilaelaps mercedesae]|uniref:Vacuolar protein-sorting-associated protein 25 n=1 Tax=Tropilaelaps mercedesae TaxID=418985 RepID=A0A1V9XNI6_9ACAR|nr:vacuolar protein-sorting-associated protein 25-like [Tropilaelaps mercedesae]
MTDFAWPWEFSFPPFFTVQPNLTTRKKQMEAWTSLVCDYCQHHKLVTLNVQDAHASELFNNRAISRKLSADGVLALAEHMIAAGKAQWLEPQKILLVLWRSREEWAKLIYDFVVNAGMTNSVCTFFELVQGDDTAGEAFHGLDVGVFKVFLMTLEEQQRAEIIGDDEGVKFF